jgi:small-conductance mechanosensitive channel
LQPFDSMLDLTWWQALALAGTAAVAIFGGRLLGNRAHAALYRRLLITPTHLDDRLLLRLQGPAEAVGIVIVWQVLVSFGDYPASVLAFCREVGHVGLLVAIGWAAIRLIDAGVETLAIRSRWITSQRASQALLPLARRITKVVLAVVIGVMVLARLGYSVGPLLVVIAIVGAALALAAHRPLENVFAAYAILGDHGIREGDTVRLDTGVGGVIEAIGVYSTRIRIDGGACVIVPNRKLADAQIERSLVRPVTRAVGTARPPHGPRQTSPGGFS